MITPLYLTTPIFYVNAEPHLGHAYCGILVDIMNRYNRCVGRDTYFLTGTDEHGEKISSSAAKNGVSPREFVDRVSSLFRSSWPIVAVEPDDFIRTTETRHISVVHRILQQLFDSGDIYLGEYHGLYCLGCERFLTEKELIDGKCADHGVTPKEVTELNYMFRMEQHREWLRNELESRPHWIQPERYRSELLGILREPIGDLSISRPAARVPWGIPIPWDPDHVVYVWFDALLNYVSALGGPEDPKFHHYWPGCTHVIGKDVLKQHGIFWPIMLRAAQIPQFHALRVSGHWLVSSTKMSKSIGNVVRSAHIVEHYGADAFRYYLARDMVFGEDSDFTEMGLASRLNSDLANDVGNLLGRIVTLAQRNLEGRFQIPGEPSHGESKLKQLAIEAGSRFDTHMSSWEISVAIEELLQLARATNRYLQECAPWTLAKDPANSDRVKTILYYAAECLRFVAIRLAPVMPQKTQELLTALGCQEFGGDAARDRAFGRLPTDVLLRDPPICFPKVDLALLKKHLADSSVEHEGSQSANAPAASHPTPSMPANSISNAAPQVTSPSERTPDTQPADLISIDDFGKIELRIAKIIRATAVPKAKKLLQLTLDAGGSERTVLSGIAEHYAPETLVGKTVVVVWNLKSAVIRGIESQGMILAAEDDAGVLSLVTTERDVSSGSRVR